MVVGSPMYLLFVEMMLEPVNKENTWFLMSAFTLPFVPTKGLWIKKPGVMFELEDVCWDVAVGVFRAVVAKACIAGDDAAEAAQELVEAGEWEKAVLQSEVDRARDEFVAETIKKLQSKILRPVNLGGGARPDPRGFHG